MWETDERKDLYAYKCNSKQRMCLPILSDFYNGIEVNIVNKSVWAHGGVLLSIFYHICSVDAVDATTI